MSTRTAPYVTIENTTVHIHDECPGYRWGFPCPIKNATLSIDDEGVLTVRGDACLYGFVWDKTFCSSLPKDQQPANPHHGPRTLMDWWMGRKQPYVKSGTYLLDRTKPFKCFMNHYKIVEP